VAAARTSAKRLMSAEGGAAGTEAGASSGSSGSGYSFFYSIKDQSPGLIVGGLLSSYLT
jgi:hypothetical protein